MNELTQHDVWPQPGCPRCEAMARDAGHESVAAYLATTDDDGCSE